MAWISRPCVNENMPLLTPDLLSCVITGRINRTPPFSALFTLSVNDRDGGARLAANCFMAIQVDQRPHMRPFLVGQIAGITQQASVVTPAILLRPHRRPPESGRLS